MLSGLLSATGLLERVKVDILVVVSVLYARVTEQEEEPSSEERSSNHR